MTANKIDCEHTLDYKRLLPVCQAEILRKIQLEKIEVFSSFCVDSELQINFWVNWLFTQSDYSQLLTCKINCIFLYPMFFVVTKNIRHVFLIECRLHVFIHSHRLPS